MDFKVLAQSAGAYAVTAGMAWLASRYHLTGDQVAAITTDVVGLGAAATGIYLHNAASKNGGSNGH